MLTKAEFRKILKDIFKRDDSENFGSRHKYIGYNIFENEFERKILAGVPAYEYSLGKQSDI